MKTATVADIMAMRPCEAYTNERVTELYAGREALTLAEILALDIPTNDRLWVVFTGHWFDKAGYVELACRMAEQALGHAKVSLVHVPDGETRPAAAITAAEDAIAAARSGDNARAARAADAAEAAAYAARAADAAEAAARAAYAARAARAADAARAARAADAAARAARAARAADAAAYAAARAARAADAARAARAAARAARAADAARAARAADAAAYAARAARAADAAQIEIVKAYLAERGAV